MAKTPVNYKAITPAMLAAAGSADTDPKHNYILVTDDKGFLHHVEQHNGKYNVSGAATTVPSAVTMLRNDATD